MCELSLKVHFALCRTMWTLITKIQVLETMKCMCVYIHIYTRVHTYTHINIYI